MIIICFRFLDLLLEEDRRRSVQDLPRKSSIARRSTSTSNVSDNEDRILAYESGSSKGVHFSPVVSEVNWNNDSQSTPSTAERESSYSLSSTPERDAIETFTKVLLEQPPRATPQRSQRFSGSQPDLQQVSNLTLFTTYYFISYSSIYFFVFFFFIFSCLFGFFFCIYFFLGFYSLVFLLLYIIYFFLSCFPFFFF